MTYNITIKCDTAEQRDEVLKAVDTLALINDEHVSAKSLNLEGIIKFGNDSNIYFSRTRKGLENSIFDKETVII
jgi:hypothetical protein